MEKKEYGMFKKRKTTFREKHAEWSLGILSFTESSFLPILVDPFLVAGVLLKRNCWLRYALIASVSSVIGGVFGYLLGSIFFEVFGVKIISIYNLTDYFEKTVASFNQNSFLFVLIGAFTPIPYKVVAIVGGVLKINIFSFIIASIIGRFARFFIVAYITKQFGEYTLELFTRRFHVTFIAIGIGILVYIALIIL